MATTEEKFRFVVKIMPPRRPDNSLFQRLGRSTDDEPTHTFVVPAVASETFGDVFKRIADRHERNYGLEEAAKGWFHKLQDRYGADIDANDGVGDLGYGPNSPREDLVLIMLRNALDRDGSIPDDSGLRPPGFGKRRLSAQQLEQSKRRKVQTERFGAPLDELDEDMPIVSRERSHGPGDTDAGAEQRKDADGFTVPALPGPRSTKRKRFTEDRDLADHVQSSMEGERDSQVIVPDSQDQRHERRIVPDSLPTELVSHAAYGRSAQSVPAEGRQINMQRNSHAARSLTAAPAQPRRRAEAVSANSPTTSEVPAALVDAVQSVTANGGQRSKQPQKTKGPPTPISGRLSQESQQPPESAQRPKATLSSTAASVRKQPQSPITNKIHDAPEEDPIEDDELLQDTVDAEDDGLVDIVRIDEDEQSEEVKDVYAVPEEDTKTPGGLRRNMLAHTPASSGLALSFSSQGSGSRNPRSQHGPKSTWTAEEDAYLRKGLRSGLSAIETVRKFSMDRTASAARSRRLLLASKDPSLKSKIGTEKLEGDADSAIGASQKHNWTEQEVLLARKAISDGYDALEIQQLHFPQRSQDSVNRKVLGLQEKAWKLAEKEQFWPNDSFHLRDWTAKDNCKLKRAFREGMPLKEVKDRFFGRHSMEDVKKKVSAYRQQIKAMGVEPSTLASKIASSAEQTWMDSSPAQRAMEARDDRRESGTIMPRQQTLVPSSPPRQNPSAQKSSTIQAKTTHKSTRSSSPMVHIPSSEQVSARDTLSRQQLLRRASSEKNRQTQLPFTREKGKGRAGPARPSDSELDAQYRRRSAGKSSPSAAGLERPPTTGGDVHEDAISDSDHTPVDDLEKLDAQIELEISDNDQDENGKRRVTDSFRARRSSKVVQESQSEYLPPGHKRSQPRGSVQPSPASDVRTRRMSSAQPVAVAGDKTIGRPPVTNNRPTSAGLDSGARRRRSRGSSTLQSPVIAGTTRPSIVSQSLNASLTKPRVDTRAAEQLSIELQRSLSQEGPVPDKVPSVRSNGDLEEESQAFQTQDPATSRSQRFAKANPGSLEASYHEPAQSLSTSQSQESAAFQTQDPATSRSQRAAKVTPSRSPEGTRSTGARQGSASQEITETQALPAPHSQHSIQTPRQSSHTPRPSSSRSVGRLGARPSPYDLGTKSQPTVARDVTGTVQAPAASAPQPGRLPARGQSYAARLREAQNVAQPSPAAVDVQTYRVIQTPSSFNVLREEEHRPPVPREQRSPSPTDSSIWARTANATELGMDRNELFEDLKLNTLSMRAMKYNDWEEAGRIRAKEKRLHKDRSVARKIARGEAMPDALLDPDSPAKSGAEDAAPEEVARDNVTQDTSISEDENEDEEASQLVADDDDFVEAPEEMNHDRHFSEVEDEDDLQPGGAQQKAQTVQALEDGDDGLEVGHQPPGAINEEEEPFTHFSDDENDEELELPTVPVLSDPQDSEITPLTQEALQELENSGAEASPRRLTSKRKSSPLAKAPKTPSETRHRKSDSADRAAMPPPPLRSTMTASSSPGKMEKANTKRARRRRRIYERNSMSGSDRSSSIVPSIATSDPVQQLPTTPAQPSSSFTAINQPATPKEKPAPPQISRKAKPTPPTTSSGIAGGLLSLARNAHIPTPPKRKPTPKKQFPDMGKREEEDESEDESSSSSD